MKRSEISRMTKETSREWREKFPKVAAMETDPRGLPIPANIGSNSENTKTFFSIRNMTKEIDLFCSQKCAVTGSFLEVDDVWFIANPGSAFSPFGVLTDAPMCGDARAFSPHSDSGGIPL